jgi:hypothetical protein
MHDLTLYYLFLKCNLMHYYFDKILSFAKSGCYKKLRRDQCHLPPSACRVLFLPLAVRNYMYRVVPRRQVGRWPGPYLGVLQVTFSSRGPHLPVSSITRWGQSHRPSSSPSRGDRGCPPLPFSCPSGGTPLSLSIYISLSEPMFPHWKHDSPPALPHPRAGRRLIAHRVCPQDPMQGREHAEKIES